MNSLTNKRFAQYQQKLSNPHHEDDVEPKLNTLITNSNLTNTKLDSVITNTGNCDTKLASVITNTGNCDTKLDSLILFTTTSISGVQTFSLPILSTQYSSVIDIGVQSGLYTFYWSGDKDSTYINYQILVSADNITYHPFTKAVFTQTPTKVETHYQMPFRYHKLEVFNNNASTAANTDLHYSGRI